MVAGGLLVTDELVGWGRLEVRLATSQPNPIAPTMPAMAIQVCPMTRTRDDPPGVAATVGGAEDGDLGVATTVATCDFDPLPSGGWTVGG